MSSFIKLALVSLVGLASCASCASYPRGPPPPPVSPNANPNAGCAALSKAMGPLVFFPSSPVYKYENSAAEFWSQVEVLAPLCVFRPKTAGDVALAVTTLKKSKGPFALRSGGHMGIAVCSYLKI